MTIVFWQDNKVHELDRSQSDRSLLDYLRCEASVKSVKEGCAQGDCGACAVTVVQADPHHGLHIRVVNSCIKPLLSLDQSLVFVPLIYPRASGGRGHVAKRCESVWLLYTGFCDVALWGFP